VNAKRQFLNRRESLMHTQARQEYHARDAIWRMVPFCSAMSEGVRERIDRICVQGGRHLGDVLADLVQIGLDEVEGVGGRR
jgi:hypothetical protein